MPKVKVMHVITGLHVGDAEMMLYRLLQNTRQQQAVVVSLKEKGRVADLISELGVPVYSLGVSRNIVSLVKLKQLNSLIKKYQPDVMQTWLYAADLLAGFAAKKKDLPVIWNIRQSETAWVKGQWHIAVNQRVNGWLSGSMPKEIVYCANNAQKAHQAIGYKNNDGLVITNGIDPDKFDVDLVARKHIRKEWGVSDRCRVIGIVGRYDVLKNQHRFLRVFKQLLQQATQPVYAVMAGRGVNENNKALILDIDRLGLQNDCLLLGERSDIPAIMNGFDMHLLTSDNEGWPNVLAEAMSCSLPVVSTDVSDVAHILGSKEYVADVDNELQLVNACNKLLGMNNQQLRKVGKQNRQRVIEYFSLAKTVEAYDKLYLSYLTH